jgi:PsbN protein
MQPAQIFILSVAILLVGITAFSIYTAFGPPAKELDDPYEMHED